MPSSTPRKKKPLSARPHPFSDKAAFDKMMADYLRDATATPEAARNTLVRIGIITRSGKLSKNYR